AGRRGRRARSRRLRGRKHRPPLLRLRRGGSARRTRPDEYVTAFFRCWTRKEAYVKARGHGLTLALDRFEVPLEPGATRVIASCLDDPSECSRWSLREIVPAPGYLGA